MTKYNLSDKIWLDHRHIDTRCVTIGSVKEFIRLLKEEFNNSELGWEGHPPEDERISRLICEKIDKIAGDELI